MTGEPFVSGLAGGSLAVVRSAAPAAAAVALLVRAREQLADESAGLEPSTRARWDGSERHAAEPDAIAQKQVCDALLAVLDEVLGDVRLRVRMAAAIGKRVGL